MKANRSFKIKNMKKKNKYFREILKKYISKMVGKKITKQQKKHNTRSELYIFK